MRNLKTLYKLVLDEHLKQVKEGIEHTFICGVINMLHCNFKAITTDEFRLIQNDFQIRLEKYPHKICDGWNCYKIYDNNYRTEFLKQIISSL